MAKKAAPQPLRADPTLPKTTLVIGGTEYTLCFDLGALADAEEAINRRLPSESQIDILYAMPRLNAGNCRMLFAVALRRFHPEIPFEAAKALATANIEACYKVREKVSDLWIASMPEPTKGDAADPLPAGGAEEAAG